MDSNELSQKQKAKRKPSERMILKQAATRAAIIEAALDLFSREPYKKVTIADIMKKAGYSVGTYYSFFADKEDLILQATRDLIGKANAFMTEVPQEGTAADRIRFIMVGAARVIADNQMLFNLFMATEINNPLATGAAQSAHARGSLAFLAEQVKRGVEDGEFRDDTDPVLTAELLQSVLQLSTRHHAGEELVQDMAAKTDVILRAIETGE